MIRKFFVFLALSVPCGSMAVEAMKSPAEPRPIAGLLTIDPWSMVVGSDTPQFALYEDGQVIFLEEKEGGEHVHMTAHLTEAELTDVKAKLLSFVDEPIPKKINLRPGWTDQPQTHLFFDFDGHKVTTSVYGLGTSGVIGEAGGETKPDTPPAGLMALHQYMSEFQLARAQRWIPEQLEVMLWDYSYAPDTSIQWPSHWPGLNHPTTRKRGDTYSIFLPGEQEEALIAFLATRKEKGAVALAGKKWAMSYRRVFPAWRSVFDD